jgi:hypothetical protein
MTDVVQVGARHSKDRIRTSIAQLNSVSLQMGEQLGNYLMAFLHETLYSLWLY